MKLLVADDERWIRKGIIKMIDLERFSFEEVLEAGTLKEYEEKFLEARPEIVVSDVRFPNGTSCELCQKLHQKLPESKFVMLSGYNDFQYVKAALGYKAVDYLLKPVEETKLFSLLDEISYALGKERRYLIENVGGETVKILVDTIYSVEAKGHYIRLHTSVGDYEYKKNLSEIAGELMENQPEQAEKFVSTHRSFIVSLAAVERVQRTECILSDGSSVPVSRNAYKSVNEAFIRYYMEHGDMCEK